ncbi:MAG: hypothetical protein WDZ45_08265 [Flavobacteriaceae bacterium]
MWYETYFELLKPDGSSYGNQEVRVSERVKWMNGELVHTYGEEIAWNELYIINDQDSISEIKIFGLGCENCTFNSGIIYAGGPDECGYGYFENWIREMYYLIEFPEQEMDTLLIKDILEPGGNRSFEYYINSVKTEIRGGFGYPYIQVTH